MTQRRTDVFDRNIAELGTRISELVAKRRDAARDMSTSAETLASMTAELQALREKVAGQQELRQEAAKLDQADAFTQERQELKARCDQLTQKLKNDRAATARKLDRACALVGEALQELEALNTAAWPEFVSLVQALALSKHAKNETIDVNRNRVKTGSCALIALVHSLKAAGLGQRGVLGSAAGDPFFSFLQFRTWWGMGETPLTIEDAMVDAAERTAADLDRLFAQAQASAADHRANQLDAS